MATATPDKLETPTDLGTRNTQSVADGLNAVLGDLFALYMKTKNFHWHMSGPHFRDYHLLFDEQAAQIFGITDAVAERVRKTGNTTLRSIGSVQRQTTIRDNDADYVAAADMLKELRDDNLTLVKRLREAREAAEESGDTATSSIADEWIDQAEERAWFLFEAAQKG